MKVEEVMSEKLIVGYVPGNVKDALQILAKNNKSGMPILKKDTKNVVGVVTRTDIFKNPNEDQLALIMTKEFESVSKDHNIVDAAKLLYKNRIHGLPVLNNRNHLVGIISPTDILKKFPEGFEKEIKNYFTNLVVPVYYETPIDIIMEIISVTNEHALPVIDDQRKLCGIVTDGDLFKLSHIRESVSQTNMGMGGDEDEWTWEGIRDTIRLHYSTSEVSLPSVPVKEIMITDIAKAFKNTPVKDVAKKMIKNQISHVPVVDSEDHLMGMITDIDLMACWF